MPRVRGINAPALLCVMSLPGKFRVTFFGSPCAVPLVGGVDIDKRHGSCFLPKVSKMRPRFAVVTGNLPPSSSARWRGKVFHNTYTWKGRTRAVRGWSVKLQHQGRRRTFSLTARTQEGAAAEAEELYVRLLAEGWEVVDKLAAQRSGRSFDKTDVRHWKKRLLIRKGDFPAAIDAKPAFSAHIDHAGAGYYFPLAVTDPDSAAAKALMIYQTVRNRGWKIAGQTFPREVCLAFHWASAPLLWTYTTIHTMPLANNEPAPPAVGKSASERCFAVADADLGIRRALVRHLERHLGWRGIAVPDVEAASAAQGAVFCLLNTDLHNTTGLPMPSRLTTLPGGVPAIAYSVHADSDAAFVAPQGGIASYLYKRLTPDCILEPVQTALEGASISFESLQRAAQSYFRSVLKTATDLEPSSTSTLLTQREQQVLSLLCKGYVDKEIASALGISPWTVRGHLKHVFAKLKVRSRIEAMLWEGAK